jgi:hypothetical protein
MIHRYVLGVLALAGLADPAAAYDVKARVDLEPLIAKHAKANNVPAALVHRVIIRESRYNPRAVGHGGALGLMQIKHATARALGYPGPASGLLDAETNLTYGVRYLAGAYRVADGDHGRAVGFYARGYYYDAKRRGGMQKFLASRPPEPEQAVVVAATEAQPKPTPSVFDLIFAGSFPSEAAPAPAQPAPEEAEEPAQAAPRAARAGKRTAALTRAAPTTAAQASASDAAAKPAASPRPAKAKAAALDPAGDALPGAGEPDGGSPQPAAQESKVPVPPRRAAPALKAKPVVKQTVEEAAAQSEQETAADPTEATGTPSLKRSARPARPSAASGANRPAQRASARPDDPDRHP